MLLLSSLPARLSGQETDNYLKSLLSDYYKGRIVRAKVTIPAGRKGLEIVDGKLRTKSFADHQPAAQPGEPLLITGLQFKSKSIDVEFDGGESDHPSVSQSAGKNFASQISNTISFRLHLQFPRQLTVRDLNIQTINRFLSAAVDVSALTPVPAHQEGTVSAVSSAASGAPVSDRSELERRLAERRAKAEGIETAPTRAEEIPTEPGIGEMSVECSIGRARLYIDGAFSGYTPRTVRIRAGVHTVLILCDRCTAWEKQFFVPTGKVSLIRADVAQSTP